MEPASARILVVDDSRTAATVLERTLRHGGHRDVTVTTDSTQVLSLVERLRPDVLLTDLNMPPPGGLELIAALQDKPPGDRPAILVFSGDTRPETERQVLAAGAQGLITKPFELAEVLARIADLAGPRPPDPLP